MAWATEPLELSTERVTLRTLSTSDIEAIVQAIHDPTGWSGRMWGIDTPEKIRNMLNKQIEAHAKGECNPFVYFVDGKVAGITRYHSLFANRKALEIGGTCLAPQWRRTFVNTEVKSLLLAHAFEQLGSVRVELRVDCTNYVSQLNVLRLGATFEGVIRHWQVRHNGDLPDGMLYSITNIDWPEIKERLTCLRNRHPLKSKFLPWNSATADLAFGILHLGDASELLNLIARNRSSLTESFRHTSALQTIEEAQAAIADRVHCASSGSAFYYGVFDRKHNHLIGQLQLKHLNWQSRTAELAYIVDGDYRRQGVASEMLRFALEELFTKHNFYRLTIRVLPNNFASIRLAEKFGFKNEGICRGGHITSTGEHVDCLTYSKLRTD